LATCEPARFDQTTGAAKLAADCSVNVGGFVGHETVTNVPFRVMLNGGWYGLVTSAHVNPTRISSLTSFSGLDVDPPDLKKNLSMGVMSLPPAPTAETAAAGGEAAPNEDGGGLTHKSHVSSEPAPPI
jgi:hypothetical protein